MKTELYLSSDFIDEVAQLRARSLSLQAGAVVTFCGVVRAEESGKTIEAIDYESFDAMARHQFQLLFDEIGRRWPIESIRLIHRTGIVPVNEASLWVEVVSSHRAEAFAACQFLIDQMKLKVPIWKRPQIGQQQ